VVTNREYFTLMPQIRERLEAMRILTLGRHGNWEYLNMDAVWNRAKEMAERLKGLA
jgi:UDP-galactopyranose mutase